MQLSVLYITIVARFVNLLPPVLKNGEGRCSVILRRVLEALLLNDQLVSAWILTSRQQLGVPSD